MYHIVYKTTNILNGNFYIGKHSTNDLNDGYFGSGKVLKNALRKYGKESFVRDIIAMFETEQEAYKFEYEYLIENLNKKECYNIIEGGMGWTSKEAVIASKKSKLSPKYKEYIKSDLVKQNASIGGKIGAKVNKEQLSGMYSFTTEQRSKWSTAYNSERVWITDGKTDKRIKNNNKVPNGWYKGRVNIGENPAHRKGKSCWTNGVINVFSETNPSLEFKQGMTKETPTAKMPWWNNNKINKRSFVQPEGFIPGKIYKESIKVECPHCGKVGGKPVMGRHHFNNCKHRDKPND